MYLRKIATVAQPCPQVASPGRLNRHALHDFEKALAEQNASYRQQGVYGEAGTDSFSPSH